MNLLKKKDIRNAVYIGAICSLSYFVTYLDRNILSVTSPQMIEAGVFNNDFVAKLSSAFFFCYAVGQLLNGIIGERIKTKYMVASGLGVAGLCSLLFPHLTEMRLLICVLYGAMGFFLSMVFSPMSKLIAENTTPIYATRCTLGMEVGAMLGAPAAGAVAIAMAFRPAFHSVGVMLLVVGALFFFCVQLMERKGIVSCNRYPRPKEKDGIRLLIKNKIVKFTAIAALTGIVRTSVVFWLSIYASQHLGFSPEKAAVIFTISTLVISFSTFFSVFTYEKLGYNMELTIFLSFILSACSFAGVFLIKKPIVNVAFLIAAIFFANCAAVMIWTRYCPSLRNTGMVATATGFLDFISYMAASLSNFLLADAVDRLGWGSLILIWCALMLLGVVISIPAKRTAMNTDKGNGK